MGSKAAGPTHPVMAVQARLPSREDSALVDAGQELYKNSLTVGRDFCKSMIESSIGALGVYYALFSFMLPGDFRPRGHVLGVSAVNGMLLPVVAFLAAAIAATVGFAPIASKMSLNVLRGVTDNGTIGIEETRNRTITRRRWWGWGSFALFLVGLALAAFVIRAFAVQATEAPAASPTPQYAIIVSDTHDVFCGELVSPGHDQLLAVVPLGSSTPVVLNQVSEVHLVERCP